jgi:hypothetical protein
VQAYKEGSYIEAETKLQEAFEMLQVPSLGLWYARALIKNGKLLEALDVYTTATTLSASGKKSAVHEQAKRDAAAELAELQPRIPRLTLTTQGPLEGVEVVLDSKTVPHDTLGSARPLNPGVHHAEARLGERHVERSITIAEGAQLSLELDLSSLRVVEPPAVAPPPPEPIKPQVGSPVTQAPAPTSSKASVFNQRNLGWAVLGLGGVATLVGATTGIVVHSKKSQLDESGACDGTECSSSQRDLRVSYNRFRLVSGTSFIVGAVGIAAGASLLLWAPKTKSEPRAGIWMGIGTVSVEGAF